MKNTFVFIGVSAIMLFAWAASSFAAGLDLVNGGLGQVATNPQQFGIAVCDKGSQPVSASLPIAVDTNGQMETISSAASIAAGQCEYSYLDYSQLNMQPGQSYSVNVTIDPQHTEISNSDNSATYSVTVPGKMSATQTGAGLTANASNQLSSPIAAFFNWFFGLFKRL
jgi:hypothetical protein